MCSYPGSNLLCYVGNENSLAHENEHDDAADSPDGNVFDHRDSALHLLKQTRHLPSLSLMSALLKFTSNS